MFHYTGDIIEKIIQDFGVGARPPNDEFFQEGNNILGIVKKYGLWEEDDEDFYHEPVSAFSCRIMSCRRVFDSLYQYDLHYNASHRYVCSECRKMLHTPHLLDLHISENHDSYFAAQSERKPMFQCYLEECKTTFENPRVRKDHCLTVHKFPSSFPFELPKLGWKESKMVEPMEKEVKKKKEKKKAPLKAPAEEMEIAPPKKTPKKEREVSKVSKRKTDAKGSSKTSYEQSVNSDPMCLPKSKILGSGVPGAGGRQRLVFNSFVRDLTQSLPNMETDVAENRQSLPNMETDVVTANRQSDSRMES